MDKNQTLYVVTKVIEGTDVASIVGAFTDEAKAQKVAKVWGGDVDEAYLDFVYPGVAKLAEALGVEL
jgi:nitrous oxide reductase accessory protein NosL